MLGSVEYPERTYWFSEGYVNDLYRSSGFTTTTQSVTINYAVDSTSDNGYAVIGGSLIELASGTTSVSLQYTDFPILATSSGTQSYNIAYVIDTTGSISVKKTNAANTKPTVAASDIVLGWGTGFNY